MLKNLDAEALQVPPLRVTLADGSEIISNEEVKLPLIFSDGYYRKVCYQRVKVVMILTQDIFLGIDWLHQYNPSIDWIRYEIFFDKCDPCILGA